MTQFDEAAKAVDSANTVFTRLADSHGVIRCMVEQARLFGLQGNSAAAADLCRRALMQARELNATDIQIQASLVLGMALTDSNKEDEAQHLYEELLRTPSIETRDRMEIHYLLAWIHRSRGSLDVAHGHARTAVQLSDEIRLVRARTRMRILFGSILATENRYDEAKSLVEDTLTLPRTLDDIDQKSIAPLRKLLRDISAALPQAASGLAAAFNASPWNTKRL